jgi:hypothetical protein
LNLKVVVIASAILIGLGIAAGAVAYVSAGDSRPVKGPVQAIKASALKAAGLDKKTAHAAAGERNQAVCRRCHSMQTPQTPWHRLHLETPLIELTCHDCHLRVSTGRRTAAGKVTIDRTLCLKCHLEVFSAFTAEHERDDWMKLHRRLSDGKLGAGVPSMARLRRQQEDCFKCHRYRELNFCAGCHD